MPLLGFLMNGIAVVLSSVIYMLLILTIARIVLSWVSPDPRNMIVQMIYSATDPFLEPLRRRIPPLGMLDLSPIVMILVLYFLRAFLVDSMTFYAGRLIGAS